MRRREFLSLVGGAAAAWPVAVRAQARLTVPPALLARADEVIE